MRYATELRSITGGERSFTMELTHYDIVPHNVQQRIAEKAEKAQAEKGEQAPYEESPEWILRFGVVDIFSVKIRARTPSCGTARKLRELS